jgi:hypothetical protein
MLVLYTEKQLIRAYKVYILEYCANHYSVPPDLETFRIMFESNKDLQDLASLSILDN